MAYYIIVIGSLCLMMILMFSNGKVRFTSNKNLYIFCSLSLCWIISAFRSVEVGADTDNYARIYRVICNSSWKDILSSFKFQGTELGFNVLAKLFSYISGNYYAFQVLLCAIFCFGFYPFIKKNSTNAVLALAVFYGSNLYLYSLNISRQMIAVMLVANAWDCLIEKKKKFFLLLVFVAFLFHSTAIVFGIAYVCYYGWKDKKIRKGLILAIIILLFTYMRLFDTIKPYLRNYYNYTNYLDNNRELQTAGAVKYFWAIIVIMSIYLIYQYRKDKSRISIIGLFSLIFVIFNIIGLEINYLNRIGYFFMPFLIPLFDKTYYLIKNEFIAKAYMISAILCLDIYFILSTRTSQYIYSSFLF